MLKYNKKSPTNVMYDSFTKYLQIIIEISVHKIHELVPIVYPNKYFQQVQSTLQEDQKQKEQKGIIFQRLS